jgi:YHS domain-containing protein
MALPFIRTILPILIASFAFAQTPAPEAPQKGDSLAPRHDTTVQVTKKKVKKTPPKAAVAASKLKPQSTCPVQGGPIDKTLYVDCQGKRIYVCCAGCLNEVKKDPAKYIKKIEKAGQSVEIIDTGKVKQAPPSSDKTSDSKGSGMGSMKM